MPLVDEQPVDEAMTEELRVKFGYAGEHAVDERDQRPGGNAMLPERPLVTTGEAHVDVDEGVGGGHGVSRMRAPEERALSPLREAVMLSAFLADGQDDSRTAQEPESPWRNVSLPCLPHLHTSSTATGTACAS